MALNFREEAVPPSGKPAGVCRGDLLDYTGHAQQVKGPFDGGMRKPIGEGRILDLPAYMSRHICEDRVQTIGVGPRRIFGEVFAKGLTEFPMHRKTLAHGFRLNVRFDTLRHPAHKKIVPQLVQ